MKLRIFFIINIASAMTNHRKRLKSIDKRKQSKILAEKLSCFTSLKFTGEYSGFKKSGESREKDVKSNLEEKAKETLDVKKQVLNGVGDGYDDEAILQKS